MLNYGTDKPDLRNPLIIKDITQLFTRKDVKFDIFKKLVSKGSKVRCIVTKNTKDKPRSFFDNIDKWAKEQGASGLAYFTLEKTDKIFYNNGLFDKVYYDSSLTENRVIVLKNYTVEFTFLDLKFTDIDSMFYFSKPINLVGGMWANLF